MKTRLRAMSCAHALHGVVHVHDPSYRAIFSVASENPCYALRRGGSPRNQLCCGADRLGGYNGVIITLSPWVINLRTSEPC